MKTKLAVSLIVLGMLIGALLAVPPARAIAQVVLDPPKFHPLYYVPGEQLQFTVTIAAGDPTLYDILVTWDDGVTRTNWSGNQFNDVTIAGSSVVLAFNIPAPTAFPTTPDGDWYWVEVHDSQWIERNGTGPGRQTFDTARFSIRTWTLTLETGRAQYLPGDLVTITWSANMIRDGSLAPAGYGQLWVYDWPTNNALITPNPYILPGSTGQFQFRLNNLIPTNRLIVATAWYNDTQSNPDRFAFDSATAAIDGLRMITNVVAGSYEPGGIVTVDISAKNTDFPPLPPSPGAADVNVDITVTNQRTGLVEAAYGATNLSTDLHGNLRYVFQLAAIIQDGTPFLVTARGVFQNGPTAVASDTFTVSSRAGMTLVLSFDKSQYLSGDTVHMTVDVSGSAGPFTYVYEARDSASGNLLGRVTQGSNRWDFPIPTTFDGSITFYGTADDGQGNRRTDSRSFTVLLGILVVNLDRNEYNAGETVTATYALTRNAQVLANPTYYYEILDTSRFPNVLVKSGVATGSSVSYQVPPVPASSYMFRITAAEAGRALSGSATANIVSGVILAVTFDRTSYNPGDTMRIGYTLLARGLTRLPSSFTFVLAVLGAPSKTVQTTSSSGELTYTIPVGANTGQLIVSIFEIATGASAYETVNVGAMNPLWSDLGGVPAIVVVMGLFLILAYIVIMLMWRRMMPGMAPRAPGEKPPIERGPSQASAQPGPAPMTVTCKACSAPIEITTSKRPIEVMCPSCGETQMVQ